MSSTALLIIDIQEGFITKETEHVIDNIYDIIKDNTYNIIITTKFMNYYDSPFVKHLQWKEMISDHTELLQYIESASNYIIEKHGYQCSEELIYILKENSIENIHIVGVDTDACVLINAMYLFDNGFNISIHSQACASTGGVNIHNFAIEILKRNIGAQNII